MLWVMIAGAFALFQGSLLLLFAWEQARYHRGRAVSPLPTGDFPAVRLIVPCRGVDPQMEDNLRALFELRYPRLEFCFVVETLRDSAVEIIRRLQSSTRVDCRIVEAGLAVDTGQKVHNLIAACRLPRGDRDVLAFVDSDARPHPDWLSRLTQRLAGLKYAVVTGYRWYEPVHGDWPSRLVSAINNIVIGLLGPHGFNLVWGGAWAIRGEVFDQLGLPDAWRGSLSDDLIISRLVRKANLRVAYEPHALVTSPAVFTWNSGGEFLRRQFLVVRNYVPRWWHFGFWGGLFGQLTLWGLATAAVVGVGASSNHGIPALLSGVVYLLGVCRWGLSLSAVRPFIRVSDASFRSVSRINIWAWPLVSLATWGALLSAAFGRTIVWRGIRYSMDAPNRTRILNREPTPEVASIRLAIQTSQTESPATAARRAA